MLNDEPNAMYSALGFVWNALHVSHPHQTRAVGIDDYRRHRAVACEAAALHFHPASKLDLAGSGNAGITITGEGAVRENRVLRSRVAVHGQCPSTIRSELYAGTKDATLVVERNAIRSARAFERTGIEDGATVDDVRGGVVIGVEIDVGNVAACRPDTLVVGIRVIEDVTTYTATVGTDLRIENLSVALTAFRAVADAFRMSDEIGLGDKDTAHAASEAETKAVIGREVTDTPTANDVDRAALADLIVARSDVGVAIDEVDAIHELADCAVVECRAFHAVFRIGVIATVQEITVAVTIRESE